MKKKRPITRSLFDTDTDTASRGQVQVTFTIPYQVDFPFHLVVSGENRGGEMDPFQVVMKESDPGIWTATVAVSSDETMELKYTYTVRDGDTILRSEPLFHHVLRLHYDPIAPAGQVQVNDRWVEPSAYHRFMDQPLAPLMKLPDLTNVRMPTAPLTDLQVLCFRTEYPLPGELLLCGGIPSVGSWTPEQGLPLTLTRCGYTVELSVDQPFDYKLVLKHPDGTYQWEEGDNRHYTPGSTCLSLTYEDPPLFTHLAAPEVKQLEGTALPIFSLRTDRSYGIGDLGDAVEFVHWLKTVGQQIFQFLPIYDTSFTGTAKDTYPYNAITTFGIHPIYLDVRRLPYYLTQKERRAWEQRAEVLNTLPQVDYPAVLQLKTEVISACFDEWLDRSGDRSEAFLLFCDQYKKALIPYCIFCSIRDENPGLPVEAYPPFSDYSEQIRQSNCPDPRLLRYAYIQYQLYRQLEELHSYAQKVGILLKGDLPIGVGRNSVDAWLHPEYFHLDREAGSPPDVFSADGQNWGFPTYDWEAIARDDYSWWQERFSGMEAYISMIRVDHILGFFRIWSIPADDSRSIQGHYVPALGYAREEVEGLESFFVRDDEGHYHPLLVPEVHAGFGALPHEERIRLSSMRDDYYHRRNEDLWRSTAYHRLSGVLRSTDLLICAEDLGVLPQTIHEVLEALDLVTLEVLRMPKKSGTTFVRPQDLPSLSVLTTSTHDTSSLRAWWQELSDDQHDELAFLYGFQDDVSPAGLVRSLRKMSSRLLILPLQDWCVLTGYGSEVPPEKERINDPADPHHIWDYRMPGTINDLPTKLL